MEKMLPNIPNKKYLIIAPEGVQLEQLDLDESLLLDNGYEFRNSKWAPKDKAYILDLEYLSQLQFETLYKSKV